MKNCQNALEKDLKDWCIGINMKQKARTKIRQIEVNRLLVYSNSDVNAKNYKAKRYFLPKGNIKDYNVFINRRNFFHQQINSNISNMKK